VLWLLAVAQRQTGIGPTRRLIATFRRIDRSLAGVLWRRW
jgi:hypothetical protein